MDKEKLYYIVKKGTNDRIDGRKGEVLIADSEAISREMNYHREVYGADGELEGISIADYEKKFRDNENKDEESEEEEQTGENLVNDETETKEEETKE